MTPEELARAIAENPRHAAIAPALLARICAEEHARHKKDRDRVKAVKSRLHQIHGAYLADGGARAIGALRDACTGGDPAQLAAAARGAMACHVSTRERLPHLEAFYALLFDSLPDVETIADIGCGLGPLFLLAVPHPPVARYFAYDIDRRVADLLGASFAAIGQAGEAALCDAVAETPPARADAALLLKLLPVLDAQRGGRGLALLDALEARYAVVSFPVASLSGRGRGQAAHYARLYEEGMQEMRPLLRREQIGSEVIYILGERRA